jgi:hypothetical protein
LNGTNALVLRGRDFENWLRRKTNESGITDLTKACGTAPSLGNGTHGGPPRRNIQAIFGRYLQTTTTTGVTNNTMDSNESPTTYIDNLVSYYSLLNDA